jgi:hypothetical protein
MMPLCRVDGASHAARVSTPLPVQGHDPHRVTGLHVHDLCGQVCQTHPVPTHVHGGGVEAGRLRAPEQDDMFGRGGWQIEADQAAAPLEAFR